MADDHRPPDVQGDKRLVQQIGLLRRGPGAPARALAVAEAGTVEHDDAVGPDQLVDDVAGVEVVSRDGVAVQQHHGVPGAPVGVVQPDAVHLDEPAFRRILTFRPARGGVVEYGQSGQASYAGKDVGRAGGWSVETFR